MRRALAVLSLLTLAACAQAPGDSPGETAFSPPPERKPVNLVRDGYQGRFQIVTSVLQSPSHGPQICQAMAQSLPPQCGGPDLVGWKWDGLKAESAAGTTWGTYKITGTFDGKTFTLTEPASDGKPEDMPAGSPSPDFVSPCKPVKAMTDPSKATSDAMEAASQLARNHPDFGEFWIDQPTPSDIGGTPGNDPQVMVLNVSYTKDLAARETELRKIWGGALCVSKALRTNAELLRIQQEIGTEPGLSWSSPNGINSIVEVGVYLATEKRQRELDAKYGTGTVILYGALKPID